MILTHDPFVSTPDSEDNPNATEQDNFGDMVQYMDKIIGKIVTTLDELELRENTILFFTGDNGTHKTLISMMGETEIVGGKGKLNNAGTHVPLIASWKGIFPENRICDELVDFCDFFPTVAELGDAPLPEDVTIDGKSLVPLLMNEEENPREWVFVQLGDNYFIRNKRWKLFKNAKMYDMENDPFELAAIKPENDTTESAEVRPLLKAEMDNLLATETSVQLKSNRLDSHELLSCYPNPFNSSIVIKYSLKKSENVELAVFNILGKKIKTLVSSKQPSGTFTVNWDGTDDSGLLVSSGTFFIRLNSHTIKVCFSK